MVFRLKLWRQGPCSAPDMVQPSVSAEGTTTGRWETTRGKEFLNGGEGSFLIKDEPPANGSGSAARLRGAVPAP